MGVVDGLEGEQPDIEEAPHLLSESHRGASQMDPLATGTHGQECIQAGTAVN